MALTDTGIRALKPTKTRYVVTDGRGLCLEVLPSGKLSWLYRYRLKGRAEKVVIARYPDLSLKAARNERDTLAGLVSRGQSPAREKQLAKLAVASNSTMGEFAERYYREVVLRNRKDPRNLRRYLDNEILPALGKKVLSEVTATDVQSLVFRKRDSGQETAAAQMRNLIKRIFDYALVCGAAQINPALALPLRFITKARARTRALSPSEIRTYLHTLYRSNIRRQFKLALHLVLLTLVRKSEMLLAQWKDVDLDAGEWQIPAQNSKSKQPHIVYLSTTEAQPGTVRLWQARTEWAFLDTGSGGNYDWKNLDTWLDKIAEHQPRSVIYTFGLTPCWISSSTCDGKGWRNGHNFTPSPPSDLTASGSPAFTAFVTALVEHCSPAGHCVKDYIKYWEMWNEPDNLPYWTGTPNQLYDMFAPVIPIIRNHVPGALVSTPPMCAHTSWMASWMTLENTYGRLSDYYGFHVYLRDYTPEVRMGWVQDMLDTKNANGWDTTPWMNTETGYDPGTFTCSTQYTAEDCRGQMVRWHVLQYAYQGGGGGAYQVGWFNWKSFSSGSYDTTYYTMMQWLTGATFTASCTNQGTVWSCPLTKADGSKALIVWDTAGYSGYTPAAQYIRVKKFLNGIYGGLTIPISPGQWQKIGVVPFMFESAQ